MKASVMVSAISRRAFLAGTATTTALLALPGRARAQDRGNLRVAVTGLTGEVLDPMMEVRNQVSDVGLLMFDSLLEIGPQNELVPGLAESWEIDDSGTVWTFKLREGVQFHRGYGEVTAEDAVASLQRWMHPDVASSGGKPLQQAIEALSVVDTHRFEVRTKGRRPTFPFMLSPHEAVTGIVLSKKQLAEGGDDFAAQTKILNENPVGSGVYEFESHQRGRSLSFTAVDGHWRANPEIRRIEFLIVPDTSTQYLMLQSGEVDMMQLTPDQAQQAAGEPAISVHPINNAADYGINMYGTYEPAGKAVPTSDPRVRKAISLAINRQGIVDALMGGLAKLPIAPWGLAAAADGMVPAKLKPWLDEVATYDPDQAKALLAEAGFPDGFAIAMREGQRAANLPNTTDISLAIAAQLGEVGIKVDFTTQEYTTLRPYLVEKQADPYIAGQLVPFVGSPRFTSQAHLRIFFATFGTSKLLQDPHFDELVEAIEENMDTEERHAQAMEAIQIMADSWVSIPVISADALFAVRNDVIAEWHPRDTWPYMSRQMELLKLAS